MIVHDLAYPTATVKLYSLQIKKKDLLATPTAKEIYKDTYRWGKELTVTTVQMVCAVLVQAYYWLSENKGRDISLDLPIDT